MNTLKQLFDDINRNSISFDTCDQNLHDFVFDLNTVEAALIGIADQLLSSTTPTREQLNVLNVRFMEDNTWLMMDGGKLDLSDEKTLLRQGKLLVSLQQQCLATLNSR